MEPEQQAGMLQGVRVLDLTRVLAGPFASMILADFGAEVVKVELPGGGDEARGFGPFVNGESAYFASVNRGKKSVAIDLRSERGQELVRSLAGRCDLLLENFRPGSMARFGLDFDSLHAEHPRLVYASISGFGQTGPYAERPAYDVIIQAMSGIASITGIEGQPPVRVGSSIADLSAALYGVIGMVAALARARETGRGQHLDVSMLDCQIALLENAVARYDVSGEVPAPLGSRHPAITPFQFFRAADGYLVIAAGNNRLWRSLCETIGSPELCEDERFATNEMRTRNHDPRWKSCLPPRLRGVRWRNGANFSGRQGCLADLSTTSGRWLPIPTSPRAGPSGARRYRPREPRSPSRPHRCGSRRPDACWSRARLPTWGSTPMKFSGSWRGFPRKSSSACGTRALSGEVHLVARSLDRTPGM